MNSTVIMYILYFLIFHNSSVNTDLKQSIFGSINNMLLSGIDISDESYFIKNENTTFQNEEVTIVDTEPRTFGQLEQKVADLEKLATNIQDIQKDIQKIQRDVASIPKKEELAFTIEAALNKAKLKAIGWLVGTSIALAGVIIAAIKIH